MGKTITSFHVNKTYAFKLMQTYALICLHYLQTLIITTIMEKCIKVYKINILFIKECDHSFQFSLSFNFLRCEKFIPRKCSIG